MTERLPGFDPLPSADWPAVADGLRRPWPKEAAAHDLRWHAMRTRVHGRKFPGRPYFVGRWGITDWEVKNLLRSNWRDPAFPAASDSASAPPEVRQRAASPPPAVERMNADTLPVSASAPPEVRQRAAKETPRAEFKITDPPITDHREDPSGGVAAATAPPKPDPALDLYAVWKSAHPTSRALTADNRKAAIRILAECGGLEPAATYLSWVRESGDERARQIRGDAPWPDGSITRRDDLESLSRHIPARLASALEWQERDRSDRQPTPRAGAPPGQPRAGPSNRIAAAEDDRQARTRRMLAEPEIDPFATPLQLTGK